MGRYRGEIFQRAFGCESEELRVKSILHNGEQSAVLGPAEVKDWPVDARASEVLSALFAVTGKDEVVGRWAVFTAAYKGHPLAIGGDANIAEWAVRSKDLGHGVDLFAVAIRGVPQTEEKNALGVLIRFGVIRRVEHQTGARWMPNGFPDIPFGFGEGFGFGGFQGKQPEAGGVVLFVHDMSVVFFFFLFFFPLGFSVLCGEGALCAVRRPRK